MGAHLHRPLLPHPHLTEHTLTPTTRSSSGAPWAAFLICSTAFSAREGRTSTTPGDSKQHGARQGCFAPNLTAFSAREGLRAAISATHQKCSGLGVPQHVAKKRAAIVAQGCFWGSPKKLTLLQPVITYLSTSLRQLQHRAAGLPAAGCGRVEESGMKWWRVGGARRPRRDGHRGGMETDGSAAGSGGFRGCRWLRCRGRGWWLMR